MTHSDERMRSAGMVYSPAHGDMAFTVPLFDEFMCRAMQLNGD